MKLHGEYSTYEIARDLRLGYSKLKSLISEASKTKAEAEAESTPAFIQMEIPTPQPKQNQWLIEMENVDGSKMKISGSGSQMLDVALICQNFVGKK